MCASTCCSARHLTPSKSLRSSELPSSNRTHPPAPLGWVMGSEARRWGGSRSRFCFFRAHIEPEGRVLVAHERGVRGHAQRPAVHAHDELKHVARIAVLEEEDDGGEQDEYADEAGTPAR